MSELENARSPQETVQAGLRILARIIAREVLKDQLANIDVLLSDSPSTPPSTDVTPVEVGKYLKGNAQR